MKGHQSYLYSNFNNGDCNSANKENTYVYIGPFCNKAIECTGIGQAIKYLNIIPKCPYRC